jgi:hypothetical protein
VTYRPDDHVIETRRLASAWVWCFAVFLFLFAEGAAKPHLEGAVSTATASRTATFEALRPTMSTQSQLSCEKTQTIGSG